MIDPTNISDYAHHNEEAARIWYEEVGQFGAAEAYEPDPYDEPYDPYEDLEDDYQDGAE